MNVKRIFALMLILCMTLNLLPLQIRAADYYQQSDLNNIKSSIISNSEYASYVNLMMKYHILSSADNWRVARNLKDGKSIVFFFDGCSDNNDHATYGDYTKYHLSAYCAVVQEINGIPYIVYENENCSTIPDNPRNSSLNSGTPVPTVLDGVYNIISTNHNGRYAALNVQSNSGAVPVIRCTSSTSVLSTSTGINIHARSDFSSAPHNGISTSSYSSTGCFIVGLTDNTWKEYNDFIYKLLGVSNAIKTTPYSNGSWTTCTSGLDAGLVIVDRSMYKHQLKSIYGDDNNNSSTNLVQIITKYTDNLDVSQLEPTNPQITKNAVWYDKQDTVTLTCYADYATNYHIVVEDDWGLVLYDEDLDGNTFSFPGNQFATGTYWAYMIASNSKGKITSEKIEIPLVGVPGYTSITKDYEWYDISDTIQLEVKTVVADGAIVGIDKKQEDGSWARAYDGEAVDFKVSIAANHEKLGYGDYAAYFSVYNGSGSIDTEKVTFSVVKEPGYTDFTVSQDAYKLDEIVSISVNPICSKGQTLVIDKNGTERVVVEEVKTLPYTMEASKLGVGQYSAYFTIYNGSGYIDTERIDFVISEDTLCSHNYVSEVIKESTCTEAGVRKYTCSLCQDSYTESIDKIAHQYSDEWTVDVKPTYEAEGSKSRHCVNCDAKTDVTVIPKLELVDDDINDSAMLSLGNVKGKTGDTVAVPIILERNPGVIAIQCKLKYDSSKVKLVNVESADIMDGSALSTNFNQNPYILSFGDGLDETNITTVGNLAIAYFEIMPAFTEGTTKIELIFDSAYDKDLNEVDFETKSGEIEIQSYIPGDVNGDGQVKLNDAMLLRRYVAGWDVTIDMLAGDVNRDGQVKLNDAMLLRRYVAGWDVVLK